MAAPLLYRQIIGQIYGAILINILSYPRIQAVFGVWHHEV